jgi:toxin-antitoxin system PIN domain toxin
MALLDVNVLIALAWDSHVHHVAARRWFASNAADGWATCPITESGFVRVSANRRLLPHAISVDAARQVLTSMRGVGRHRFLANDVSVVADDLPGVVHHRHITDAVLLTVARRHQMRLVTFDRGVWALTDGVGVELLSA